MTSREWEKWRKRARLKMPQLAARVFALRGVAYPGHGFHYALECDLGGILMMLNDYTTPCDTARQIIIEVKLEELHRRVAEAEKSGG